MNTIVDINGEVLIEVIFPNCEDQFYTLSKGLVVGALSVFPVGIFPSNIALSDVLDLEPDGSEVADQITPILSQTRRRICPRYPI